MKLGQAPAATILLQQDSCSIRGARPREEIDTFYGRNKNLLSGDKPNSCYDLGGGNLSKRLAFGNKHLAKPPVALD